MPPMTAMETLARTARTTGGGGIASLSPANLQFPARTGPRRCSQVHRRPRTGPRESRSLARPPPDHSDPRRTVKAGLRGSVWGVCSQRVPATRSMNRSELIFAIPGAHADAHHAIGLDIGFEDGENAAPQLLLGLPPGHPSPLMRNAASAPWRDPDGHRPPHPSMACRVGS